MYRISKSQCMSFRQIIFCVSLLLAAPSAFSASLLLPMDEQAQRNHLKAYGIVYWSIARGQKAYWWLNYRGGSFLLPDDEAARRECNARGVSFEALSDQGVADIRASMSSPAVNQSEVPLEKTPRIAVYSPPSQMPWDDAVTLALTYAEIPYTVIYDREILNGALKDFDWLHLHHEDFTGQYGKFYGAYKATPWYIQAKAEAEQLAASLGYKKVSKEKLAVAQTIADFVIDGGFMFAMCSATDSFDIALAAAGVDICGPMFDNDATTPNYQSLLNYNNCFAFTDFILERDPDVYEFSSIDTTEKRPIQEDEDYFNLEEFSAKWDPVPTMLCQNHTTIIKGFLGQTTAFDLKNIKATTLLMGQSKKYNEARYVHGVKGKGFFTFYGGHDPEDYQHKIGDPKTELELHPTSPGYRLILNNILFPAARPKPHKT